MLFLRRMFVALIGLLVLAACQPDAPLPNGVTSADTRGEISLRFPDGWVVYPETYPIEGRQGVTLVLFPTREQQPDIDQFPVIRIAYDARDASGLATGQPLVEVTARQAQLAVPDVVFEQPELLQVGAHLTGFTRGSDGERGYYVMVADFEAENGIVVVVLSAPGSVSSYEVVVQAVVANMGLKINATISTPEPSITPIPERTAESTAEVQPESTDEVQPESTDEVQPESTDEVIPESTAETTDEVQPTDEATPEPTATESTASRVIPLVNGLTLTSPEGWVVSTDNYAYVVLRMGETVLLSPTNDLLNYEAGQASMVIDVGKPSELFDVPDDVPVDLKVRIEQHMKILRTPVFKPTYEEIEAFTINGREAVAVTGTIQQFSEYILLYDLGARYYVILRLESSPEEIIKFSEVAREVIASMSFPAR